MEVFKNQLKEEHVSWKELHEIADKLLVPCKSQELRFNNWEEFKEWAEAFMDSDCQHEGYVVEGANGFRVKFKSKYYRLWKDMRKLKEILANGQENKKIYKSKTEIQFVKFMEQFSREELLNYSIIDLRDKFFEENK